MNRAQGKCDSESTCESNSVLLITYLIITCAAAAASIANRCLWALVGLKAATKLHECMIVRVLYSTQAAVEAIPIGQFLSRFGTDIDVLDSKVWIFSAVAAASFLDMFMKVALLVSVIPASFLVFLLLVFLYNRVQQKYMLASIVFRRSSSAAKAEVYVAVSESLQCMETWRSFGLLEQRHAVLIAALQEYNKRLFYGTFLNRWLGIRVEAIGACALFVVSLFVVIFAREFDPSTAGLAMSQVLLLNQLLTSFVREAADCVTSFNSIERCMAITQLPLEGAPSTASCLPPTPGLSTILRSIASLRSYLSSVQLARDILLKPDGFNHTTANAGAAADHAPLCADGARVAFENVSFRYSSSGDWILKDINLEFAPSVSYGICGRSGSGKSTLLTALLRLVPLGADHFCGKIVVDTHDITSLSLVRFMLQRDANLFSPFSRFSCEALCPLSHSLARCSKQASDSIWIPAKAGRIACCSMQFGRLQCTCADITNLKF
jgi:ABC-type multidrug transport system fused ATPase/permease subunit